MSETITSLERDQSIHVGIDPGISGAVAWYEPASQRLDVWDVPTYEVVIGKRKKHRIDLHNLARTIYDYRGFVAMVHIEDVHAMPKQGVSSSFAFGFAAGAIEAICAANELPITLWSPVRWKRGMGLSSDKDASRQMASRLLPAHAHLWARVKDHNRAEAALLALWGSRQK